MIPAVFDASVAVKACLPVPGHEQALAAIRCYAMVAPAFIVTEVANAIWKYHRNGDIRQIGMPSIILAGKDIRQMHLNKG